MKFHKNFIRYFWKKVVLTNLQTEWQSYFFPKTPFSLKARIQHYQQPNKLTWTMLYKSSYNDITKLLRSTHCQKNGYVTFWRFVRPAFKESGYTNRKFQLTSYFKKTLEFTRTVWVGIKVVFPNVKGLSAHQRQKSLCLATAS